MGRELDAATAASLKVTQVISAALALSVPMYGLIAWLVLQGGGPAGVPAERPAGADGGPNPELLRLILAALAAPTLVLALAWPLLLGRRGAPAPDAPGGTEAQATRFRVQLIVRSALAESVAVYGLVLAMIGRSIADFALFALPALAALVWMFPTRDRLEAFLSDVRK